MFFIEIDGLVIQTDTQKGGGGEGDLNAGTVLIIHKVIPLPSERNILFLIAPLFPDNQTEKCSLTAGTITPVAV